MTIWACFNGFMGNGAVAVIVEADTETEAAEIASGVFKAEMDEDAARRSPIHSEAERAAYATIKSVERLTLPYECELS